MWKGLQSRFQGGLTVLQVGGRQALATASRHVYFGDELYFLACGEHLAWATSTSLP